MTPEPVFCQVNRPTLHHVSLFVSDMEASKRFYTSGLGLTLREEFRDIIGLRESGEFPFAWKESGKISMTAQRRKTNNFADHFLFHFDCVL